MTTHQADSTWLAWRAQLASIQGELLVAAELAGDAVTGRLLEQAAFETKSAYISIDAAISQERDNELPEM